MNSLTLIRKTRITGWIAEAYLAISVLAYWWMTKALVNPIAIGLFGILVLLIWRKNEILGWIIGMTFLMLNLYMIAAFIHELAEFSSFNRRAMELLVGGILYFGCNISASIILLVKWGRRL